MTWIDTRYRSTCPEIMDDFNMEGEVLRDALDKIAIINRLLGGNSITLDGLQELIKSLPRQQLIRITDIGCGNGDMLRVLAVYAEKQGLNFELTGIDGNKFTVKHARSLSSAYPQISYSCADILNPEFQLPPCDIVLCTLTLHHFKDDELLPLLQSFRKAARLGFVINDLQRSAWAYYLFKAVCFIFRLNYMSRQDGLVSILRGFKKADLLSYSRQLNLHNFFIRWKWAFRYQWIVKS